MPKAPAPEAPPAPVLSTDDEALLASLLAEDPGDFHLARARIWRLGPARWVEGGPELPHRPDAHPHDLARPLPVVVVDPEGPRVLLPLDDLVGSPQQMAQWAALRVVARLSPGDLVAGLTRELRPTPWLTVAAGVGLTPVAHEGDTLRARWSDPACGFSLELVLDAADFGPLYEPGPAGPPDDEGELSNAPALRLAAGAAIYAEVDAREPILRMDPQTESHGARMSAAQRVILEGAPARRGRQAMTLRCRGMQVRGFVEPRAIVESPARYAVVEDAPAEVSSCAELDTRTILVPRATPLYEPTGSAAAALVGVVADDVELAAAPGNAGWWTGCVASPWGDLLVQFRLR